MGFYAIYNNYIFTSSPSVAITFSNQHLKCIIDHLNSPWSIFCNTIEIRSCSSYKFCGKKLKYTLDLTVLLCFRGNSLAVINLEKMVANS